MTDSTSSTTANANEFVYNTPEAATLEENWGWYYLVRWCGNCKYSNFTPPSTVKNEYRTRRSHYESYSGNVKKALRIQFERNNEIGAFMKLTNSYCLVAIDGESANFCSTLENDFSWTIPVIRTSMADCRVIGRMCAGNKHGLLVPDSIYDAELEKITSELPDSVKVQKIEERLSALGNVIACNDRVALVHPDLDKVSEETIADVLQVEVLRQTIANNGLIGSYCILNNYGGMVHADTKIRQIEELSSLLDLPITAGTVNAGSKVLGSGLAVNDHCAYAGMTTTPGEFAMIESTFKLSRCTICCKVLI